MKTVEQVIVFVHFVALYLCFTHLKTEQIVHSADNDVDCGCVSSLGSQEVLEICQKEIFPHLYYDPCSFLLLWIIVPSWSCAQTTYTNKTNAHKYDLTSIVSLAQKLQKPEQIFSKLIIL